MVKHCADHDHKLCDCGGYHYKHRPGSRCCKLNPLSPVYVAMRDGATDEQIEAIHEDVLWFTPGTPMTEWKD